MEFLKASIADLITLLFSSLQNSEGGGDVDSGCDFYLVSNQKNIYFFICISEKTFHKRGGGRVEWKV